MIEKTVYLFLAVLSMLGNTGLLRKLSISGVIWTGVDLLFTIVRFLESAKQISTSPVKLLFHTWNVELLGEYSKVIYLVSANLNGPDWGLRLWLHYELFKWLYIYTRFGDSFSGTPHRLELSTSIIIDEHPVQGCLRELKPLKMRLRSCIMILDEESPGWCLILKSTNVSKKWKFDRLTAEVLYQILVLMDDETFIVEGDSVGIVHHCIELDKFINRTIVETRSGLIAHRRVVFNEDMKAFI